MHAPRPITRRTVVGTAVWATPVIAIVSAAPAHAAASSTQGTIVIQQINMWGGGGSSPGGNFVVQASKGEVGDTRLVKLTATATLEVQDAEGAWSVVGNIPLTPASFEVSLDGGSGQFAFASGGPTLTTGMTYRVRVSAQGMQSDDVMVSALSTSGSYTAW